MDNHIPNNDRCKWPADTLMGRLWDRSCGQQYRTAAPGSAGDGTASDWSAPGVLLSGFGRRRTDPCIQASRNSIRQAAPTSALLSLRTWLPPLRSGRVPLQQPVALHEQCWIASCRFPLTSSCSPTCPLPCAHQRPAPAPADLPTTGLPDPPAGAPPSESARRPNAHP